MAINFRQILNVFRPGKISQRSHVRNLIEVACADGNYTEEENAMLIAIARKHGISAERINQIRSNKSSIAFSVPSRDEDKFKHIYEIISVMLADEHITSEEVRVSELIASRFGYPKSAVKGMVETIHQNILNGSDFNETYERVTYFLRVNQLRLGTVKAKSWE